MDDLEQRRFDDLEANGYFPALRAHAQSFCAPLWWWVQPRGRPPRVVNGGTVWFVDTGRARLGITCAHVLSGLRKARTRFKTLTCQIGNVPFNDSALIDCDTVVDVATLNADDLLSTPVLYKAASWPPLPIANGESLMAGGFPGAIRRVTDGNSVRSDFLVLLATVEKPSERNVILSVEDVYCPNGTDQFPTDARYGGMSGGPVFRRRSDRIDDVEIAAFVYEAPRSLKQIYARQAWCILPDGKINRAHHR